MSRLSLTKAALCVGLAVSLPATSMAATPRSLLVGVFKTTDGAEKAYKDLKEVQKTKAIKIDSFAVVSKDEDGKTHVSDTQQHDTRWGAVAGGVLGLLVMGPVGAAAGAGAGGLTGWLTGSTVGIPKQDVDNIKSALEPSTSAIVAVVDNKWVADVEAAMRKETTKAFIKDELKDQEEQPKESTAH
jgi:uncharacterized membrane protein